VDTPAAGLLGRAAPPLRRHAGVPRLALGVALAALGLAAFAALSLGATDLGPGAVAALLWQAATGPVDGVQATILFELRLPRVAATMLVGAALATAGAVFQALLRNPLADPHVIGISAGSALGAVAGIALGATGRWLGFPAVSGFALAGGLVALVVVQRIAAAAAGARALGTVLAGVVVSAFCSAVIMLLISVSPDAFVRGSLVWLMGDLGMVAGEGLPALAVAVGVGLAGVYASSRTLDLLAAGEEVAHTLGVDLPRARRRLFLLAALLTGVAVAAVGIVGFVGLIVPHAVRLTAGADHRGLVPLSALGGAAFLVAADLVARVAVAPAELPVGAVTALCGAPFFLWLLVRRLPGTRE
jgi:iron complex transport system permease protein